MNSIEQEKLIIELHDAHSKKEKQNKELSKTFGKDLNEAQYKKDKALSDDAYPDNAHFIYELIQNAEDSTYTKNKKPKLEFHLLNEGILVLSNQDGFTSDDVRSICVMASGNKIMKKDQFIGEKGLGFRSVFKITNTPCISSNGYEFFFDKRQSYEKPFLLKNYKEQLPIEFTHYKNTAIFLPYSISGDEINELERDFHQKIKPKLILFLNKLSEISIIKDNGNILKINKKALNNEILKQVELKDSITNKKQKYYIVRKTIDVSAINEEKRKNIKKREIVLAYPKDLIETSTNVFSFLPTEINSRFNFTIQADFLLDTSRGKILENDWNKNLFKEIKLFIIENINLFQHDTELKYKYLEYYLQKTKSNNKYIDYMYEQIVNDLKHKKLILSSNNKWEKPENIVLLSDNIKIDTKYLKILFGSQYELLHNEFKLNTYFIDKFNIKRVEKEELLESIFKYLNKYNDNTNFNENDVFYLTKIISKFIRLTDRRKFDDDYLKKLKKILPILPKYEKNKKYYLYDFIYISSEYKPKFIIENIASENEFDFTKYNFLSDRYMEDERLKKLIIYIIDERDKDNNKKTIEFFIKNEEILKKYIKRNIKNHYRKVLDFLIDSQDGNKIRIPKIPLLLTKEGKFLKSGQTIYFFNENDTGLEVLNEELFELTNEEKKYKEFLSQMFEVKEADALNIILHEYLPWIAKNHSNRNNDNDKILLKYTKTIVENFSKFDNAEKRSIKEKLYFISSLEKNKYLKSNSMYLTQEITEIIFNRNSIEKYINDKSDFSFICNEYKSILRSVDENKLKDFFGYFDFIKTIKYWDIANFVKNMRKDLDLDSNIEAFEYIAMGSDGNNIKEIENFRVYTQNKQLKSIKNIFLNEIKNLSIDYLNKEYRKKINKMYFKKLEDHFLSECSVEVFIEHLKSDITFEEAKNVYLYLNKKTISIGSNCNMEKNTIRKEFRNNKIIFSDKGEKFYPSDVMWKDGKSEKRLFALEMIYPDELKDFFVKIVGVSQSKEIRQIIDQIKRDIKEKNDDYFDLLIDLSDLIADDNEIDKYRKSYNNQIDGQYDISDNIKNARKFILMSEKIFILDNGKKNKNENFYFNDLDIHNYDSRLKGKIFTPNEKYPISHYHNLIDSLKLKKLSDNRKKYQNKYFQDYYDIKKYREMLEFAYDLLFTKFSNEYKNLEAKERDLEILNNVNSIKNYQDIISVISIDDIQVKIDSVKHYFKNNELFILDEKCLFQIISEKIGSISDKDIKDYFNEVINGRQTKREYYKNEKIKEKQSFSLVISNEIIDNDAYAYINIGQDFLDEKSGGKSLKESLAANQSDGQGQKFFQSNYSENIITDEEQHQKNIHQENKHNTNTFTNKQTSYKSQEAKELKKIEDFLYGEYEGHCQICGDTFAYNGKNVFKTKSLNTEENRDVNRKGNSLSLCHKHHEILKLKLHQNTFLDKLDDTLDIGIIDKQFRFEDFVSKDDDGFYRLNEDDDFVRDVYFFPIKLFGKTEYIKFTKPHIMEFIEVWNNN